MSLSRANFNELLADVKDLMAMAKSKQPSKAGAEDDDDVGEIVRYMKRRIGTANYSGIRCPERVASLLKRMSVFTTESLWNSMYHVMHREMLLMPQYAVDCGDIAQSVLAAKAHRNVAVEDIRERLRRVMQLGGPRRSSAEQVFLNGFMRLRNQLHERFCADWPHYQYEELCRKIRFSDIEATQTVSE